MNPYASQSKSFQRLNPHLFPAGAFNCGSAAEGKAPSIADHPPASKHPKLNKTEAAYLRRLQGVGYDHIYVQDITLRLGDDTRYTVDFVTVNGGLIMGHEVKGFMREDARVKLHVAARMYPWISFVLVVRKGTSWDVTPIKP